eukprot:gene22368-26985_t
MPNEDELCPEDDEDDEVFALYLFGNVDNNMQLEESEADYVKEAKGQLSYLATGAKEGLGDGLLEAVNAVAEDGSREASQSEASAQRAVSGATVQLSSFDASAVDYEDIDEVAEDSEAHTEVPSQEQQRLIDKALATAPEEEDYDEDDEDEPPKPKGIHESPIPPALPTLATAPALPVEPPLLLAPPSSEPQMPSELAVLPAGVPQLHHGAVPAPAPNSFVPSITTDGVLRFTEIFAAPPPRLPQRKRKRPHRRPRPVLQEADDLQEEPAEKAPAVVAGSDRDVSIPEEEEEHEEEEEEEEEELALCGEPRAAARAKPAAFTPAEPLCDSAPPWLEPAPCAANFEPVHQSNWEDDIRWGDEDDLPSKQAEVEPAMGKQDEEERDDEDEDDLEACRPGLNGQDRWDDSSGPGGRAPQHSPGALPANMFQVRGACEPLSKASPGPGTSRSGAGGDRWQMRHPRHLRLEKLRVSAPATAAPAAAVPAGEELTAASEELTAASEELTAAGEDATTVDAEAAAAAAGAVKTANGECKPPALQQVNQSLASCCWLDAITWDEPAGGWDGATKIPSRVQLDLGDPRMLMQVNDPDQLEQLQRRSTAVLVAALPPAPALPTDLDSELEKFNISNDDFYTSKKDADEGPSRGGALAAANRP